MILYKPFTNFGNMIVKIILRWYNSAVEKTKDNLFFVN